MRLFPNTVNPVFVSQTFEPALFVSFELLPEELYVHYINAGFAPAVPIITEERILKGDIMTKYITINGRFRLPYVPYVSSVCADCADFDDIPF